MPRRFVVLLALLGMACGSTPAGPGPEAAPKTLPERGLVVVPYEGVFREVPAFVASIDSLTVDIEGAKAALRTRLGLALDPDRPRRLSFVDDTDHIDLASGIVAGRRCQTIVLPAPPIARGETDLPSLLRTALARAALSDDGPGAWPAWFVAGAPLWLGGGWDRALHAAVLGWNGVATEVTGVVAPLSFEGPEADPLAAALVFRFLETEYGPGSVPDLTRALAAGAGTMEALHVATRTDAASIPVAYEGWVLRTVGDLTDDEAVRALAAARGLDGAAAVDRLADAEDRTDDPWVAAEVKFWRVERRFEAGGVFAAYEAWSGLAREDPTHSLRLEETRALSALGPGDGAEARRRAYLRDFPAGPNRPRVELALAELLRERGDRAEADTLFREVVESAAGSAAAAKASVALATAAKARGRYGEALAWLERAGDAPGAGSLAEKIRAEVSGGLPESAAAEAKAAVADLESGDEAMAEAAVDTLSGIGPAAAALVLAPLSGAVESWPPVAYRRRVLRIASAWSGDGARPVLSRLLADPDAAVGRGALEALLADGATPEEVRAGSPAGSPAAREIARRFGAASLPAEVRDLLARGDFEGRVEAARRLALVPGFDAMTALLDLATDESPPVRQAVASALAPRPEGSAKDALANLARDEAVSVRLAAYDALAARADGRGLLRGGLEDADGRVRAEVARRLLEKGRPEDVERVVALLDDPDPAVRGGVDRMLRETGGPVVGRALARALVGATETGHAMRIVRVMAHLAHDDFGYDPAGSEAERRRVAERFREFLARSASSSGE